MIKRSDMIKRLIKLVFIPITLMLTPLELIFWLIVWVITGRNLPTYPLWFRILEW